MVKKVTKSSSTPASNAGGGSTREEGTLSFESAFVNNQKVWEESRKVEDTGGGFGDNQGVCELLGLKKAGERREVVAKISKMQCGRSKKKVDPKTGKESGGDPYLSWNALITQGPAAGRKINAYMSVKESKNMTYKEALDRVFMVMQRLDYDTKDMSPAQIDPCCKEQTEQNPLVLVGLSVSESGGKTYYNAELLSLAPESTAAPDGQEDGQSSTGDGAATGGTEGDTINVPELNDEPLYVPNGKTKPEQTKVVKVDEAKGVCDLKLKNNKTVKGVVFADLIW